MKAPKALKFIRRVMEAHPSSRWAFKQELAKPSRYYGDGGTIHSSGCVDVCVDELGHVVQVWYRCQLLPFRATYNSSREYAQPKARLTGVEILDMEDE